MCDDGLPKLVNAAEGSAFFGLKEGTFRDLVRRRGWPTYKIGHAVRYSLDELVRLARDEGDR
jgi:hypothetical protein